MSSAVSILTRGMVAPDTAWLVPSFAYVDGAEVLAQADEVRVLAGAEDIEVIAWVEG